MNEPMPKMNVAPPREMEWAACYLRAALELRERVHKLRMSRLPFPFALVQFPKLYAASHLEKAAAHFEKWALEVMPQSDEKL